MLQNVVYEATQFGQEVMYWGGFHEAKLALLVQYCDNLKILAVFLKCIVAVSNTLSCKIINANSFYVCVHIRKEAECKDNGIAQTPIQLSCLQSLIYCF